MYGSSKILLQLTVQREITVTFQLSNLWLIRTRLHYVIHWAKGVSLSCSSCVHHRTVKTLMRRQATSVATVSALSLPCHESRLFVTEFITTPGQWTSRKRLSEPCKAKFSDTPAALLQFSCHVTKNKYCYMHWARLQRGCVDTIQPPVACYKIALSNTHAHATRTVVVVTSLQWIESGSF